MANKQQINTPNFNTHSQKPKDDSITITGIKASNQERTKEIAKPNNIHK